MKKFSIGLATVMSFVSSVAMAGNAGPIPVSEPGMIGIVAGGVVAAFAIARLRGRK